MPPFFIAGDATPMYARYRDAATQTTKEVRDAIEAMWERYERLCLDPGFLDDARRHFKARFWQMYLACTALDQGYAVEPSGDNGPDLLLIHSGRRVWIEATIAEPGKGADSAVRQYAGNGAYTFDEKKRILRYTQAIKAKATQYEAFIARGIVRRDEPFVLAIMADIEDADLCAPGEPPDIVRAVYPVGALELHVPIRRGDGEAPPPIVANAPQPFVFKFSKIEGKPIEIPTTGFLDGSLAWCSAILFKDAPTIGSGEELLLVRNHSAAVALDPDWFGFAETWRSDGDNLYGPRTMRDE